MKDTFEGVTRQVMLQQYYTEEKIRTDGSSGLKQVRVSRDGTKNYYTPAHVGSRFMAMHDHANYDRTVGMGELMVVMNGLEFRTRHNDYKLRMPHRTDQSFGATELIPFPPVPPSVTSKKNLNDQIAEMREYFRAFRDQNITHRDYRPYFRANLCYIEGAWTTGSKSMLENFAFLPTTINQVVNGTPHYAQWNYRILCNPIKEDLPTKHFKILDDLLVRFPQRKQMDKMENSRSGRYVLNEKDVDHSCSGRCLLDDIMMQIPGKDNYQAELHDNSFEMVMEDVRYNNHTLVNTGYYHRYFKTMDKGAMGTRAIHRGYSDPHLFVAQTTQPRVAPMSVKSCKGRGRTKTCVEYTTRYTYALPLEVVYTTPLNTWNPFNVIKDNNWGNLRNNGRFGGLNATTAYNGTNPKSYYYLTPSEFYSNAKPQGPKDPADTANKGAGILDKQGNVHVLASSGIRITTPDIEGVGQVRLRFPSCPS